MKYVEGSFVPSMVLNGYEVSRLPIVLSSFLIFPTRSTDGLRSERDRLRFGSAAEVFERTLQSLVQLRHSLSADGSRSRGVDLL